MKKSKVLVVWVFSAMLILIMAVPMNVNAATTHQVATETEFTDALENAAEGDTIQLVDDIVLNTGSNGYLVDKSIILNLNNQELQLVGTNLSGNEVDGYLRISKDSKEIQILGGSIKGRLHSYGGDITINNCTVVCADDYSSTVTMEPGSLRAENCTFRHTGTMTQSCAVYLRSGTSEELTLTNCVLEANKGRALHYCGTSNTATIENCTLSSDILSGGVIRVYGSQCALTVVNTSISSTSGGGAINIDKNDGDAEITLGEGNVVTGKITLKGTAAAYQFHVTGGRFDNGSDVPFNCVEDSLLDLTGGEFKVDVDSFAAQGYTCTSTGNEPYPYEVVKEGETSQPFYTQTEDGRTYYDSFDDAVAAVKGTGAVIYLKADAEIEHPSDLNGLTLQGRAGVTIKYNGTISEFTEAAQNVTTTNVAFNDITLSSMTIADGALTQAKGLTADTYQTCVPLLASDSLIDAQTYDIKADSNFQAKIGSLGYTYFSSAISVAATNDTETPVKDEIVLLEDIWSYAMPVINIEGDDYKNAAFTIDFAGHSMETSMIGACIIINQSNADITLKNGSVTAGGNIAVATNGSKEGIKLELDNMTIKSDTATALYLAGDGETEITGGSYKGVTGIEIRAGKLNISGNPEITGGTGELEVIGNSNGTTTSNAALAVAQHTTKKAIRVIIENGTFTGTAAVNEADPQNNKPTDVTIEIKGGTFTGSVASEDCTKFISGGMFDKVVPDEYCAEGFIPTDVDSDGRYTVSLSVAVIGSGESVQQFYSLTEAVKAAKAGDTITVIGDVTVDGDTVLTVLKDTTLIISDDVTLTNNGVIDVYGLLQGEENIVGTGKLNYHVKSITIDNETLTLKVGDTGKLVVKKLPENAVESVTWTSENTDIVTVDENGNVKAIAASEKAIVITAKSGDLTVSCVVTVSKKDAPNAPEGIMVQNETVEGRSDGKITGLDDTKKYDISSDNGATWKEATVVNGEITGLAPGSYIVRYAETEDTLAGAGADVTIKTGEEATYTLNVTAPVFKTVEYGYEQPKAEAILISSAGNSDADIRSVTVSAVDGKDVFVIAGSGDSVTTGSRIDTWTVQPKEGLSAGTYEAVITVIYNDGAEARATVSFEVKAVSQTAPAEATLKDRTYTTITLEPLDINENGARAQYSMDGGKTWQDSNVFKNLLPAQGYDFAVRYKATDDGNYIDSPASEAITIFTGIGADKNTVTADGKAALEEERAELEAALKDNAYTDEEKAKIRGRLQEIDDALTTLENAEKVSDMIGNLPDADDVKKSDADAVNEAKAAYDKLTDHEKELIGDEVKARLDAALRALAALNDEVAKPDTERADESLNDSKVSTGDDMDLMIWLIAAVTAILAAIAAAFVGRKKYQ